MTIGSWWEELVCWVVPGLVIEIPVLACAAELRTINIRIEYRRRKLTMITLPSLSVSL